MKIMNHQNKQQHQILSWQFWKAYSVQMRPYLLFISGVAGAAGIAMSKTPETPEWKCWVSFIPFFFGYGFGQALTDCFQTDTDKLSAPYRPLSRGIVSVESVMAISIIGLLSSGVLFYLLHPVSFWLSLLVVSGLATYSYIKKKFWFGGPFYNAWIVALLPAMGYFSCLTSSLRSFPGELMPYTTITFFSYANFVLIGYLKDIEADKATNYKTFPVVFGWDKTILVGDLFVLITLLVFWWQAGRNSGELLFGISGSIIIISGQIIGHRSVLKNEKEALQPILSTVRGFILLHLSIILHFQPGWWIHSIIYYSIFEWALMQRPSKYQV